MERWIVTAFLCLFVLEFLIEFVLNELNLRHLRAAWSRREIPHIFKTKISVDDYDKSVRYTLAKGHCQRYQELYDRLVTLAVLFGGVLLFLDNHSREWASALGLDNYGHGILFCIAAGCMFSLVSLPFDWYATFGLEAKFGFNKTTLKLYLTDKVKELILSLVIGVPFLWVVLCLMAVTGSTWWLWAFAFITVFQLLMIVIFPTFIAPWFNKFEPLKEGEFRERILALAKQVGFTTSGIYAMDGSKRSAHSNAYFTGIGKSKRIVLFDTLIEQMTIDQGLAVLAHEMGHYKMKHIRRMIITQTVFLFIGLYILSLLIDYRPFYAAFGLTPSSHAALVLFSLISGPFTFFLGPLMHRLSRKHEFEADHFAVTTLGEGKPMEEALVNLTVKNLSNLTPHSWYSAYHYSHPTPVERIQAIRESEKRQSIQFA